ncbi:DUF2933 domain-containing protein [Sinorhizobium fredii]|uniref:DUF2933 domain-containing protein n=1 Tax=Rhizobium fredii TaxID=380 RepID=UPI0002D69383|nr:DUF2933 domain-containing protein [Sinorhizobium fredii]MQW97188.1 DUF2933 domain-containing protein [Sinorhizobium fredii]UTY50473.1 DUF2933 domain-containing protein [Sinorhizobium fredii]
MKWERKWTLLAVSFGVIAAFFVLREHWAHALGLAPYLLLLACPLMHLFHGHGGHQPGQQQHHVSTDDIS